jgi:hypothetical protein
MHENMKWAFLLLLLLMGCSSAPFTTPSHNVSILFVNEKHFCGWVEENTPYRYLDVYYEDGGQLKNIHTKTSCQDAFGMLVDENAEIFEHEGTPVRIKVNMRTVNNSEMTTTLVYDVISVQADISTAVDWVYGYNTKNVFYNSDLEKRIAGCVRIVDKETQTTCLNMLGTQTYKEICTNTDEGTICIKPGRY